MKARMAAFLVALCMAVVAQALAVDRLYFEAPGGELVQADMFVGESGKAVVINWRVEEPDQVVCQGRTANRCGAAFSTLSEIPEFGVIRLDAVNYEGLYLLCEAPDGGSPWVNDCTAHLGAVGHACGGPNGTEMTSCLGRVLND